MIICLIFYNTYLVTLNYFYFTIVHFYSLTHCRTFIKMLNLYNKLFTHTHTHIHIHTYACIQIKTHIHTDIHLYISIGKQIMLI